MKIIIPGNPVSQARMKSFQRGGFIGHYDPRAKEKEAIREILKSYPKLEGDYPRVSFLFFMPLHSGIRKKERSLYEAGIIKHNKKPDIDNLVKLYLDCLTGICLQDDSKISLGPCIKVYHKEPKTIIWLMKSGQVLTPHELDPLVAFEESYAQSLFETASLFYSEILSLPAF